MTGGRTLAAVALGALVAAASASAQTRIDTPLVDALLGKPQEAPQEAPAAGGEGAGGASTATGAGEGAGPEDAQAAGARAPVTFRGPEGRADISHGWGYRADPGDRGLASGWQRGVPRPARVDLPHSPNAWPVTGAAGARNFAGSVGWYTRTIQIDEPGRYAIRFESAHHQATVFVDGRPLAKHTGAYLPFEVRPALGAGRHLVVVRVDWRHSIRLKRSGWHRAWFNYGGINREVTIRRMGESEVSAPTIRTKLGEHAGEPLALVDLAVRVRNLGAARSMAVTGVLERGERRTPVEFPAVRLGHGESRVVRTRVAVLGPSLWSPSEPSLYELRLGVGDEPGWRARVGLRELAGRGGMLHLNGAPVFLRGASIHEEEPHRGDALTPAGMDAIVERLRAIGATATRAQHPLHPALLERLDAAGILVWQHVGPFDSPGAWTSVTPELRRTALRRVITTLENEGTHPSIAVWNLGNEVAWNGRRRGQAAYVDRAARALKQRDPGRLVGLDVWGRRVPKQPGLMYRNVDALGATNYIGWYEAPHASAERVAEIIDRRVAYMRALFPHKVLVATEFGAEGNADNPAERHGGYRYQAALLVTHLRAYRANPAVSGMLVWNLGDFPVFPTYAGGSIVSKVGRIRLTPGLNQKGLFDYEGNPKPAVEAVRAELNVPR